MNAFWNFRLTNLHFYNEFDKFFMSLTMLAMDVALFFQFYANQIGTHANFYFYTEFDKCFMSLTILAMNAALFFQLFANKWELMILETYPTNQTLKLYIDACCTGVRVTGNKH